MINCILCKNRVLSHNCVLKCAYCRNYCHITCLPQVSKTDLLYINRQNNVWFCTLCINDSLPFNHLIDDADFFSALADLRPVNITLSLHELENKIFNPFETNENNSIMPFTDIDPDLQYYNTFVSNSSSNCDYYLEESFKKCCNKAKTNKLPFSIYNHNIRSLPKHFDELTHYLSVLDHPFTVIGLTETWLQDSTEPLYCLPNYNMISQVRTNRKGGGVSLLIKEDVQFTERNELNIMNNIIECLFIEFDKQILNSDKNTIVGIIYRPPDTNIQTFIETLNDVLSKIKSERKLCYLIGDFNINLLNSDTHDQTSNFIDLLYSHSFFPLITKPTRVTESTSTLIDNIFINDISQTCTNGILYTDLTDHYPVFTLNYSQHELHSELYKAHRDYSDANKCKF